MSKKIAVLGCGAIGSSVSADLTDAGLDVTIIDQWPAHVEVMKANGLHIEMPDLDLKIPVRAYHLCELASLKLEFDIVFLAVKSYDNPWMLQLIKPYLKSDGVLVGLQNSMNEELSISVLGPERVVGAVIELSGEIFTPGKVQRNTSRTGTWFGVGEIDGTITPRVQEIQSILSNVAEVDIHPNIYSAKWTKLIVNSMSMGPFGVTGLKKMEASYLPEMQELAMRLGKEAIEVGTAIGYGVEPVFGLDSDEIAGPDEQVLNTLSQTLFHHTGSKSRTAPIQDHLKGRKNEIEFINGLVARRGKEAGVPTPCNDAVAEIARQINQGQLEMDPSNFEVLLDKVRP
ncbi:MAG: 2-dehydropantoate 2-reductase [Nitrospinaceae bacterium]|jgi:2-dehydropantoate 2-reductase|nr:2-dehydropantoate 2-reductase [Nitrospinaceae bacterium]MBT4094136.1 2-dehydropantoate 2-reductase [Nitrospinaceae bacterium]MBT4428955.1 2-dehydropantoate 2-reductase [Nitrospinaceae bacterium]MBT5949389.1 2-dehydropantoate 2-reductase [Nitrospinaceae bacterium]MBT7855855.1 2-dehydropantoate 2-reductase [Nitrospinaceae bacterium]